MRIKILSFSVLFVCFFFNANAQMTNISSADKKYDDYAYADAIKAYESLIEKGTKDEKIMQRLANSYYFLSELQSALQWYDELFRMNEEQEPEYLYRYSQCLKATGNYQKANEVLEKFNLKAGSEKRAFLIRNEKNYLDDIKFNSGRYEIADAGINSPYSDYGSVIYDKKIVFTSARDTGGITKTSFKWTNKSFSKLYISDLMPDGSVSNPKQLRKNQKSKFNESTPIFTKDGRTMYFTRNNFTDGKRGQNDKQVTLLKLYKADFIDGQWVNEKELPFNSDQYSTAHPTLSIDEKTLYFASDMPGTLGQSDLFKVAINADGSFGQPQNLGSIINTEGRETFPFVSAENELYFASDGRPGLGGLDIFVTKINADNTIEDDVQNVGEPVNSKKDDFGFTLDGKNRNGYFSSNRDGGHGLDDIYRFTEIKRLVCEQDLMGTITDSESNEVLANVTLALFDENLNPLATIATDEKGNYIFPKIKCGKKYSIRASKSDYGMKDVSALLKKENGKTTMDFTMQKIFKPLAAKTIEIKKTAVKPVKIGPIKIGTDLAKLLHIPMNFFDLGKATIKKTSEPDLQKVVDVLNQYPNVKLDIRSHTDSRSSSESNQILSDKRAQSTKDWLISKGIDESRLTAKGYGETKLVNKCADGVKCTEKEHQQNRRSEFIIVGL
ncbi:OmpA family protein [Flavobacterium zhairuonense]|uniref:OmpA family protein n=1 Tax=Flavobacterium zhairuonense TaxID=2493631 RepID=UPI00104DFA47|nr:OmpA family protein [Flavobacterium zhairuonense]KAF2509933.1 OmpA family protein [Flavobacterium zhairuonense]